MNRYILKIALIFSIICSTTFTIKAQDNSKAIFEAVNIELKRIKDSLHIDNTADVKFVSFDVFNGQLLHIKYSNGSLLKSKYKDINIFNNRIIVGDSILTDENVIQTIILVPFDNDLPNTNNVNALRRAMWRSIDKIFKSKILCYINHKDKISLQNINNEYYPIDFLYKTPVIKRFIESENVNIDKQYFESLIKKASQVFNKYTKIQYSEAELCILNGFVCFANSEGTQVKYPINVAAIFVSANTMANDGEILNDFVVVFDTNPNNLPDEKFLLSDINKMATNLSDRVEANSINEFYTGPILFEDQAAAEIFISNFFSKDSRLSAKGSYFIKGNDRKELNIESWLNKKLISTDLSIIAKPFLKTYNNKPLHGNFQVDAEGVIPNEETILVENGILKTFISGRFPSKSMQNSNGHSRILIINDKINISTGPGVIHILNSNKKQQFTKLDLKEKLINKAKEDGLTYAFIVRKVVHTFIAEKPLNKLFGKREKDINDLIEIYRIDVNTGKEELVRGAELKNLDYKKFGKIIACSNNEFIYNTTLKSAINGELSGNLCSFIVPDAVLFSELELSVKNGSNNKLPIVKSPLFDKN